MVYRQNVTDIKIDLAQRVRTLRQERGLTLRELAQKANISLRFLSSTEAGKANPSLSTLHDLSKALDVSLSSLVRANENATALWQEVEKIPKALHPRVLEAIERVLEKPPLSIALLGLRGAGKSTLGPLLAKALKLPFIKVDSEIEREAGMSLAALFDLHGEQHVREREREVLIELLKSPSVLELAGGAVTNDATFRLLLDHSRTLWLKAKPQSHWDRVVAQGDTRPMENRQKARDELETLFNARVPLYSRAELEVDTELGTEHAVGQILAYLAIKNVPEV